MLGFIITYTACDRNGCGQRNPLRGLSPRVRPSAGLLGSFMGNSKGRTG